jgi:hypothetical protein
MTGDGAANHDADELLDGLRALAGQVDPVPAEATGFARAALGWRRIDAELAELLVDSALDSESLALTRSTLARARSVTFRASDLEIGLEIQETEPGVLILGQVAPPTRAGIDVQRDDSSLAASAEADELGRFRLELPEGGRVRLLIRRPPPDPPIETSWIGI